MKSKIFFFIAYIALFSTPLLAFDDIGVTAFQGTVVDVATAEVVEDTIAPDVYAVVEEDVSALPGMVFKVFRQKDVVGGAGAVYLYVGRLQIISRQGDVCIGRMIELAKRSEYPHVRYETVMVGDCLVLEPAPASQDKREELPAVPQEPVDVQPSHEETPQVSTDDVSPQMYQVIPPRILFKFDSSHIEPKWNKRLDSIADFIRDRHPSKVLVEGHADAMGTDAYNIGLSRRRAQAVVNYLVQRCGLDPSLFDIQPFGERRPEATNETAAGRRKNRRVYISVPGQVIPKMEAVSDDGNWPAAVNQDVIVPETVEFPVISSEPEK